MVVRVAASLLAIAWASASTAQTTAGSASDKPTETARADMVGEVIVTAQRRSERLVDVPISVSIVSPEAIERAGGATIENVTKVTPGTYIQRAIYGLSPTFRGVGSTLAASSGEQNVAMYVDNIYYPVPTGNIFDLGSVSEIEVLKGPQGTLFGRNATGGALLLRTLDPSFTRSGRFNISYERFNQVRTSAYLNVPLSDKVALNGSVAYRYSQGYVRDLKTDDIVNEGESFTARVKLLVQPTDNFSLILTGAHAKFDDGTGGIFQTETPAPVLVFTPGVGPIAKDRWHSSMATDFFIRTETDEFSARAKYETPAGTFSSYTAFLHNKLDALSDLSGTYAPQNVLVGVRTKTFSQEVNFASSTDQPLNYVVGLYYFRNRPRVPGLFQNGAPLFFTRSKTDSVAAYVDGAYKFGAFSLIAGIRYSEEKRRAESGYGVASPAPPTRFQRRSSKQWTPRLGLQYAISDQSNIYATYSRGFKSGVFDQSSPTGPGVEPETIDAYEVGYKSSSPNLSFNAAAFYYDYLNTQVNATISGNGRIVTQLFNVPKSRIYGAEGDVTVRLSDAFDLRAAAAWTHARYINFPNAPGLTGDPTNPATLGGLIFANIPVDASGKTMVRAPKLTLSAALSYHRDLSDDHRLELTVAPYYSSRVYMAFDNSMSQGAYVTVDATASLTFGDRKKITVFGRNLTDRTYKVGAGQNALGRNQWLYATPRTYGVSLGYEF